jgi:peptide-methionine (S)-S-oxide reductase
VSARAIEVGRDGSAEDVSLYAAALDDLDADFDELQFLCRSAEAELAQATAEFDAAPLRARTGELLGRQLASARRRYRSTGERLVVLRRLTQSGRPTPSLVRELAEEKGSLADLLRAERALTAGLVGAADWQSPSFLHSMMPAAGRQSGRIQAHWNDYKRDRHLDGEELERRWVAAMVDGPPGLRALLTTCGMAALTTVLSCLTMEGNLDGPVLVGAGVYHETRLLLERAVPGRLRVVDERDTSGLLRTIKELAPSAIFLDSLSNTKWMPVPELPRVIDCLRDTETYLVIDNTGLSVFSQPFAHADDSVRLIVFESLLKYAQLGLDRANAGVIIAPREVAERLSEYREHLGTNVADVAVHALPSPDRAVLERRLARLGRNALFLAGRLRERVDGAVTIVYPGLTSRPCARAASGRAFSGGCLSIVLGGHDPELEREHALVEVAVAGAAARGIALLGGSSFGFNTSRIYLTAARAECGEPFVRLAAGTEHRVDLEALADVLAVAVNATLSGQGRGQTRPRSRRGSGVVTICAWQPTRRSREMAETEKAILAGGCFWGVQDLIRKLEGVTGTRVGYSGGDVPNATYRNHGSHAEAIEITFDPERISYRDLLEFFFQIHDPTTKDRQGNDVGASYRSAIYYVDDEQRRIAEDTIADVDASGLWPGKVVTEVEPAGPFWEAEPEHQDYLERYPNGYTCHFVRPGWKLPRRAQEAAR